MATTFYAQASANRRNSFLLVLVVVVLLGALGFFIGFAWSGETAGGIGGLGILGLVAIAMAVGSYFGGDRLVLGVSGAREVGEADQPELLHVVREISLAAGVPLPRVYLIDDSAPNAFATGRDPRHASVAVTTGLLDKLDREELQGVIAHELSHVRNYDIRYALLVGVLVGTIALVADFFLRATFWGGVGRRSDSRGGGGLQALAVAVALVLAILAPLIGRLVQLAVSRQREYLADASSIELTRNPRGLERALVKVGADREVLEVANRATQHLYFTNPIKKWEERSRGLFSTHPPIIDRVNRLRELSGERPLETGDVAALVGTE